VNQVMLRVDQQAGGIAVRLWGELDIEAGAELETFLLLEASMQPTLAVLDLSQLDAIHPCVQAQLEHWHQAFADVGSELIALLPDVEEPDGA
jgi:anti-anti-sigma regulatory factor